MFFLWFPFGFLWFPLVSFGFLWFPLVCFVFLWFPRGKQKKKNPKKKQTNQGNSEEAINP